MAQLNFPNPNTTQTYTEAGITWTWNSTLGVWSAEYGKGFDETDADARYLRIDAAAPDQTRVSGEATFAAGLHSGGQASSSSRPAGVSIEETGVVVASRANANVFVGYNSGVDDATFAIKSDGSGRFAGRISHEAGLYAGLDAADTSRPVGVAIEKTGVIVGSRPNGSSLFVGFSEGVDSATSFIKSDGSAYFGGKVGVGINSPERSLDVDGVVKLGSPDGTGIVILGRDEVTPENNWHIGATAGNFEIWSGTLGSGVSKFTVTNTEIYSRENFIVESDLKVVGTYTNRPPLVANSSIVAVEAKVNHAAQDVTHSINFVAGGPSSVTGARLTTTGFQVNSTFGKDYTDGSREAYGFRSNLPAAANGKTYSFYADGDAPNFFGGNVFVKNTQLFPGVDNTAEGLMFEAAGDGVTMFGSRSNAASIQVNRNSAGDLIVFRRNGQKRGEIGITDTNITIGGLIGGPLLRNGFDLDNSKGLVDAVKNVVDRIAAIEANEVIDDATDSSLLQLIASASARLDSIEARLTALEGA